MTLEPPPRDAGWVEYSRSNHVVERLDGWWRKTPSFSLLGDYRDIVREHQAWQALGVDSRREGMSVLVPDLGEPLAWVDAGTVAEMVSEIVRVSTVPAWDRLRDPKSYVAERITPRMPRLAVSHHLLPRLDATPSFPAMLAHGDPHLSNWVVRPGGNLALVDWEAACTGGVDITLGTLWTILAASGSEFTALVAGAARDDALFWWMAQAKLALYLSWREWHGPLANPKLLVIDMERAAEADHAPAALLGAIGVMRKAYC